MSDLEKQYNSPETQVVPEQKQIAGNLTETMLGYLRESSPWLRFMGIVGFIGCGFLVVIGLFFAIFQTFFQNIFTAELLGDITGAPIWLMSLFYAAMGAVVFFPSLFTYRFGSLVKKYQYSSSDDDLEQAFKNNKSFWKFSGIITIVSLSLIPVILIAAFVIGFTAASLY